MNDETMAKLNEVVYDRLTMAMNNVDGSKEQTAFMKEAMDAIDRIIDLEKLEDARKDKRDSAGCARSPHPHSIRPAF